MRCSAGGSSDTPHDEGDGDGYRPQGDELQAPAPVAGVLGVWSGIRGADDPVGPGRNLVDGPQVPAGVGGNGLVLAFVSGRAGVGSEQQGRGQHTVDKGSACGPAASSSHGSDPGRYRVTSPVEALR